ncbi:MAG: hemerythrin domain-containing protein [Planctomycetes bacterium]|nr:hemerythrin domain-containing protein [Planctomycetota bacterium]
MNFAADFMAHHDGLAASFFAHQRALLDRDFARAAGELAAYRAALWAHMHDEESAVLPRYEAFGGDPDTPVRLFLGEHGNLRKFVDEFVARVEALRAAPDDRVLLELFDRQATFKNLMLHHDLRERNVLYPFLAVRLPLAEQAVILAARTCRA